MPKRNPDGKRQTLRKYFNTEAEALFHMKAARAESEDWWQAYQYKITSLSEFQMNDAMRALEMLTKAFPEDTPRLAEVIKFTKQTNEEWKDHPSQTGLGEGGIRLELLCLNSLRRPGSLLCIVYVLRNQTGGIESVGLG